VSATNVGARKDSPLRLVAAPFLNTRPLISGLVAEPPPGVTLALGQAPRAPRR